MFSTEAVIVKHDVIICTGNCVVCQVDGVKVNFQSLTFRCFDIPLTRNIRFIVFVTEVWRVNWSNLSILWQNNIVPTSLNQDTKFKWTCILHIRTIYFFRHDFFRFKKDFFYITCMSKYYFHMFLKLCYYNWSCQN